MKNLSNQFIKEANKNLDLIAGKEQDVHEQFGNLLLKYEEVRKQFIAEMD